MKKNFNPKVSIVIPVYNGSNYVREAINSALAQTYKNLEIVVVNDGSTDEGATEKICKSYGRKIRYFRKENGGVSTALNMGISKMTGEYFSWLSHDDLYFPDKIEKQVKFLSKLSKRDKIVLYANYSLVDKNSEFLQNVVLDHKELEKKPEYALLRGAINGITLFIPKSAFDEYGKFNPLLRCTQDYDMWLRMMKTYKFIHMEDIFTKTRIHSLQDTNKNPRVVGEGNELWIRMVESLSKEDKIRLEGTEYKYYYEMAEFLKGTPYEGTLTFVQEKIDKLFKKVKPSIKNIKVSVIIPFYNRIRLLMKSINSVKNQSHDNLEILLINDASTENISLIKQYLKEDKRARMITNHQNMGVAYSRNVGIKAAKGEYIVFLDSDDLFKKNKIEEQLKMMCLTGGQVSHTSYVREIGKEEEIINSGTLEGIVIPRIIANCTIATPTVMIKNSFLKENGFLFEESFTIGEDVCFWLKILRNEKLLGIDIPYTIVYPGKFSTINNLEKQIIGVSNILSYVLSDKTYSQYRNEIASLCDWYSRLNREMLPRNVQAKWVSVIGKINRMFELFKYQGVGLTMRKAFQKYGGKVINKIKRN